MDESPSVEACLGWSFLFNWKSVRAKSWSTRKRDNNGTIRKKSIALNFVCYSRCRCAYWVSLTLCQRVSGPVYHSIVLIDSHWTMIFPPSLNYIILSQFNNDSCLTVKTIWFVWLWKYVLSDSYFGFQIIFCLEVHFFVNSCDARWIISIIRG